MRTRCYRARPQRTNANAWITVSTIRAYAVSAGDSEISVIGADIFEGGLGEAFTCESANCTTMGLQCSPKRIRMVAWLTKGRALVGSKHLSGGD